MLVTKDADVIATICIIGKQLKGLAREPATALGTPYVGRGGRITTNLQYNCQGLRVNQQSGV